MLTMAKKKKSKKDNLIVEEGESDIESSDDIDNDNKDFDDYVEEDVVKRLVKADAKNKDFKEIDYTDESDDDDEDEDIMDNFEIIEDDIDELIEKLKLIDTEYIIPADERRTKEKISEYELPKLIMVRASMLSLGSVPLVDVNDLDNDEDIATLELKQRKIPLLIKRIVGITPEGKKLIEIWDPKEMTIIWY